MWIQICSNVLFVLLALLADYGISFGAGILLLLMLFMRSTLLSLELISKSPILEGGTTSSLGMLDKCTTAPNTVRLKGPGRLSPPSCLGVLGEPDWPDIVKDFMSVSSAVMENLYLPAAG